MLYAVPYLVLTEDGAGSFGIVGWDIRLLGDDLALAPVARIARGHVDRAADGGPIVCGLTRIAHDEPAAAAEPLDQAPTGREHVSWDHVRNLGWALGEDSAAFGTSTSKPSYAGLSSSPMGARACRSVLDMVIGVPDSEQRAPVAVVDARAPRLVPAGR